MANKHLIQVIAITSAKGGVGKTTVAVNLSIALAKLGRRVLLFDANLGLAGVDSMLDLKPKYTLQDVLEGRKSLEEVVVSGPCGVSIVPAASGVEYMSELPLIQHAGLIQAFSSLADNIDALIIDTASGLNGTAIDFVSAANEVLIVVCDEYSSIVSASVLIRLLSVSYRVSRFRVLVNMVRGCQSGYRVYESLLRSINHIHDVSVFYAGSIPYDEKIYQSVKMRRAVQEVFPKARSAKSLSMIALKADAWPIRENSSGRLEYFCENIIKNSTGANLLAV